MNYKKLSLGLGVFSIALGAFELLAGANLLAAPAASANMWNRAAGDVMDIAAAGAAVRNSPQNKATWGTLAFVVAALGLDTWVARGLDKQTGKIAPVREGPLAA